MRYRKLPAERNFRCRSYGRLGDAGTAQLHASSGGDKRELSRQRREHLS